jgi:thiol-disulfide isomerase/thioredoxin
MKFLHIQPTSKELTKELDKCIKDGKNVYLLIYMEGCGPCNATRPEWAKLKNVLNHNGNDNIVIADIDHTLIPEVFSLKDMNINGFPTMKRISHKGEKIEEYETNKSKHAKDRSIDSFVDWIKTTSIMKGGRKRTIKKNKKHTMKKRKTHKSKRNYKRNKK